MIKGKNMVKFVAFLVWVSAVAFGVFAQAQELFVQGASDKEDRLERFNTWMCPQKEILTDHYLAQGLSKETDVCSLEKWSNFDNFESVGFYPVAYIEWFEGEESAEANVEVEVFRVRRGTKQLYAIRDYIDEDLLEGQKIGILPNVAYEQWHAVIAGQEV